MLLNNSNLGFFFQAQWAFRKYLILFSLLWKGPERSMRTCPGLQPRVWGRGGRFIIKQAKGLFNKRNKQGEKFPSIFLKNYDTYVSLMIPHTKHNTNGRAVQYFEFNFPKCSRALHSPGTILRKYKEPHIYILIKLSFGLSVYILKLARTVYYITTMFESRYLKSLNNALKELGPITPVGQKFPWCSDLFYSQTWAHCSIPTVMRLWFPMPVSHKESLWRSLWKVRSNFRSHCLYACWGPSV